MCPESRRRSSHYHRRMCTSSCHRFLGRFADRAHGGTFDTLPGTTSYVLSSVPPPTIAADCCGVALVTVHHLPDIALLDIFRFYHDGSDVDEWHTLVHVCQRWRDLVFESPHRLNLRLLCNRRRPVMALPDIWSALPIVIEDDYRGTCLGTWDEELDNIIAALEHPDRVRSIELTDFPSSIWEELAESEALQVPFPELTHLVLIHLISRARGSAPVLLPDSFLGGSAPRLQTLKLRDIPFPALPNLLLSACDLVTLSLTRLSPEFISPESMVACLSSLNKLQTLWLGFPLRRAASQSPRAPQSRSSPQSRVVLPALTDLTFEGMTDYSEDFLPRIDTPMLNKFSMSFLLGPVFDVPHFKQFISRANALKPPKVARVRFDPWSISLEISQQHGILETSFPRIDWQVDSIALVCGQLSPFRSPIERFDLIAIQPPSVTGEDDIVTTQLLELFRHFTAIQSLRVSKSIVSHVATALQELIEERATEVLPNLRDLFLGGSAIPEAVREVMQQFVTARQLSGQPVAVHHGEFE
jgi:hypothetical protein